MIQSYKTLRKKCFIKNGITIHTFGSSLSHGQHPYLPTLSDAADIAHTSVSQSLRQRAGETS